MTDFAALLRPDRGEAARTIHRVSPAGFDTWLAAQPARARAAVEAARFKGKADSLVIMPGDAANDWSVAAGAADPPSPWELASAASRLPAGTYRLAEGAPEALGWLMAQHRFGRYRAEPDAEGPRVLLTPDASTDAVVRLAAATALVRDLVDTPAADMAPGAIADAVQAEGKRFGAEVRVIRGEALLDANYPAVHAVGRASAFAPCLIDLSWGDAAHRKLTLVGKGVSFDSGGLDIKPASGMLTMKKDMGGAAHALALATLVMAARLPVRLRLLIPAVENAISGNAFRPGDVLATRKGLSVEIGNTDAEGRLILCDALTAAQEDAPDLILDFATLTGAARVALGPELPALFANDDAIAEGILAAGRETSDPLWRLPLWAGYKDMLKSEIADINNAGEGGFAGAITAALFLQRFVGDAQPWAHIDLFAWNPSPKPGRPKGGAAMTLAAVWRFLETRYRAKA